MSCIKKLRSLEFISRIVVCTFIAIVLLGCQTQKVLLIPAHEDDIVMVHDCEKGSGPVEVETPLYDYFWNDLDVKTVDHDSNVIEFSIKIVL